MPVKIGRCRIPDMFVKAVERFIGGQIVISGTAMDQVGLKVRDCLSGLHKGEVVEFLARQYSGIAAIVSIRIDEEPVKDKVLQHFEIELEQK